MTPTTPSSVRSAAVAGPRQRSTARPASSIAGSAPAPMNSSAVPSWPSVTAAWSRTAGSDAPHAPQNAPKTAKLTYAFRRSIVGPDRGLPVVTIDNRAAARAIGAEVFAHARAPAVLSFPLDRARESRVLVDPDPAAATFPITRERLAGYRAATTCPLKVAVCARNSAAEGARLATALMGEGTPPDAIAAMSDELALGALQVAPDVPITGWDDSEAAEQAGLTTVWQSLHDQGAECARIALGGTPSGEPAGWRIVRRTRNGVRRGP